MFQTRWLALRRAIAVAGLACLCGVARGDVLRFPGVENALDQRGDVAHRDEVDRVLSATKNQWTVGSPSSVDEKVDPQLEIGRASHDRSGNGAGGQDGLRRVLHPK